MCLQAIILSLLVVFACIIFWLSFRYLERLPPILVLSSEMFMTFPARKL